MSGSQHSRLHRRAARRRIRPSGFPLIGGLLLAALGFGQFILFLDLDELGMVEVNALGHGLLLWIAVAAGAMLMLAGVLLDLLKTVLRIRRR